MTFRSLTPTSRLGLGFLSAWVLTTVACAEPSDGRDHRPHRRPSKEFIQCLKANGIEPPPRPSDKDKEVMRSCREKVGRSAGRQAFHECLVANNVKPPERPKVNKTILEKCEASTVGSQDPSDEE